MKKIYFLSFLFFLVSNNDIYYSCPLGKFGNNCEKECRCETWSSSKICSKIEGRCLDCKFGHFGKECNNICRPECKTNLCCAVKDKKLKSNNKIEFNAKIIKIKFGNDTLNISTDFNVGYPLTIFKKTIKDDQWNNILSKLKNKNNTMTYIYKYSDYTVFNGELYNNSDIEIGNEKSLKVDIPVIVDNKIEVGDIKINGVMGLGFLNTINIKLFNEEKISLNIASYEIKNDKVSIIFGDLFGNEKKYVHKLSHCNTSYEENSNNTFLKCPVEGMKRKTDSNALKLDNIDIHFSLNQDSSFILNDIENYTDYIIKYFFKNKNYEKQNYQDVNNNKINYYCFKSNKINKLTDFGFVINKFYYSFQADKFFVDWVNCSKGFSKFIIEFSNTSVGLTFGKNFFKDTQITIDNEERKIYFYTKHVEYFSGKLKEVFKSEPELITNPFRTSIIGVGIVLLLNIISFLIYFYFKRKKEKIK